MHAVSPRSLLAVGRTRRVAAADIGGTTRNLWLTFRKSTPLAAIPERKFDAIRLERFDQVVPVEAAYTEMQVE